MRPEGEYFEPVPAGLHLASRAGRNPDGVKRLQLKAVFVNLVVGLSPAEYASEAESA